MEVSSEVLKGLQLAGSAAVNDATFSKLAQRSLQDALGSENNEKLPDDPTLANLDPGIAKECHAALMTFMLEAARTDADSTGISTILEECRFAPERIEALSSTYTSHKPNLRAALGRLGARRPHIVNVDWRLDYYIKNNHLERVNKPLYLIDLQTEESNNSDLSHLVFSCTQEQLQDLVSKLKDATKSLEKFSQK